MDVILSAAEAAALKTLLAGLQLPDQEFTNDLAAALRKLGLRGVSRPTKRKPELKLVEEP